MTFFDDDIRVVVCDDHALFRRGLVMALEEAAGIEVVGEASDGHEAVEVAADLGPDVVLMDVQMPVMSGIEATHRLRDRIPTVRVLMLSVDGDEHTVFESIRAGASGYVVKETPVGELVDAVRALAAGHPFVGPALAADLIAEYATIAARWNEAGPVRPAVLSPREHRVLDLLADGADNQAIATALGMTEIGVRNHIRNVLAKLHLHTRTEAVLYAVREGIVGS